MNLFFFISTDIEKDTSLGIRKKILGQIEALRRFNYKVDLCYVKDDYLIVQDSQKNFEVVHRKEIGSERGSKINRIKRFAADYIRKRSYDVIYVRSGALNYFSAIFFKMIKMPGRLIFLEIPTYPYTFERLSKTEGMNLIESYRLLRRIFIDFLVRHIMRFYIDYIVLTIPKSFLWGIPVVSIDNAISIERIPLISKSYNNGKIKLFTATNIQKWQGLERIVYGLYDYQKRKDARNIEIKIAGEGAQKESLTELVKKLQLKDQILFCGPVRGEQLDEMFNEADIAIGSLGRHRQRTNICSTLKVKEYCARGIPFIYSNDEPMLTGQEPFALKLPADETPVDFERIIDFINFIKKNSSVVLEMRKFAEINFDWSTQMKKIHMRISAAMNGTNGQ